MEYNSIADCCNDGQHLTECDADGYCNFCGYQDSCENNDNAVDLVRSLWYLWGEDRICQQMGVEYLNRFKRILGEEVQ